MEVGGIKAMSGKSKHLIHSGRFCAMTPLGKTIVKPLVSTRRNVGENTGSNARPSSDQLGGVSEAPPRSAYRIIVIQRPVLLCKSSYASVPLKGKCGEGKNAIPLSSRQ